MHDEQTHPVEIRLVSCPLESEVGRPRTIDTDDDTIGPAPSRSTAHHHDWARAVPDDVPRGATEPNSGSATMATGSDDDEVVRIDVVDQRCGGMLGRRLRNDLDARRGLSDDGSASADVRSCSVSTRAHIGLGRQPAAPLRRRTGSR